ncbi:MAG: CDP-alcohol phosphatidyltransferase family protein [archaeon GB-1867-005]|nr:CDP-alcohol phosphatidyltransferase family protein [Candidatus Culexmicrobium cathedralense]
MIRGKATDGIVSRYINRKISSKITKLILKQKLKITPNQVSLLSFIMGAASLPLYLMRQPIIAGIVVQLSSIIDGVDGELARALRMESEFGAFFDAILDRLADIAILFGATAYLTLTTSINYETLLIALGAISGSLMVSYIHAKSQQDLKVHPALIGRIRGIASRDVRLFIIFAGSMLGLIKETLILLFILTYTYVIGKFVEIILHIRPTE